MRTQDWPVRAAGTHHVQMVSERGDDLSSTLRDNPVATLLAAVRTMVFTLDSLSGQLQHELTPTDLNALLEFLRSI